MNLSSDPVMETEAMQADTQETDGGQNTAQRKTGSSFFREEDPVVQDFNAFFEKLSSIDDLTWDSESSENTPAPRKQTKPRKAAPARARTPRLRSQALTKTAATPRPKMNVFDSNSGFRKETSLAAGSGDSEENPDQPTGENEEGTTQGNGRATSSELAWMMKMVLAGLVLFGLGLGAGWAALTLPERFQRALPETAKNVQLDPAKSGPVDAIKSWLRNTREKWAQPASDNAKRANGKGEATKPMRKGAKLETVGPVKNVPARRKTNKISPVVDPTAIRLPLISRDDLFGNTSKRPLATPPAVGRYALQVGACGSTRCVESYRALLKGRAGIDVIQVVTQPAKGGKSEIHRIRVSPLTRAEALRLKRELISADARFNGSYLISLR